MTSVGIVVFMVLLVTIPTIPALWLVWCASRWDPDDPRWDHVREANELEEDRLL